MTYTFTCAQGHEPQSWSVEADNDDDAVTKIKEATGSHLAEAHADMQMSDEEADAMIRSNWTKS